MHGHLVSQRGKKQYAASRTVGTYDISLCRPASANQLSCRFTLQLLRIFHNVTRNFFLCMALQLPGLTAFAAEADEYSENRVKGSEFNFSTFKYVIDETDNSFEVTVNREGDTTEEAWVLFKAIDVIGTYGRDYYMLDEDGSRLTKTEGTIIPIDLGSYASQPEEPGSTEEPDPVEELDPDQDRDKPEWNVQVPDLNDLELPEQGEVQKTDPTDIQ